MKVILDTGPLVALLYRRELHHRWTVQQIAQLPRPFYTCEAVITEAHYLLRNVPNGNQSLIALIGRGGMDLSFSYSSHRQRVDELMLNYSNVPMSFADACLVCLAEQLENSSVLTLDSDFRIYRKHRNQILQAPWNSL
ncbi:MAG: PIN domain-containing protein [Candidatus Competibacteraceae bacterium]